MQREIDPREKCDHCEEEFGYDQRVAQVTCHQEKTVRYLCEKCYKEADDYNKAQQALN